MNLPRSYTLKLHKVLDEFLPPAIRDSRLLFSFIFGILFKDHAKTFLDFKTNAWDLSKKQFSNVYKQTSSLSVTRLTDLNDESLKKILDSIKGKSVLEVGCGKGFLANEISKKHNITACDIVIDKKTTTLYKDVTFKKADIEKLPFKNKSFDTVVCTHTLEHVLHISKAIEELRRVTKQRLIIVVPKQRPFKYTFDLHLHFFPYVHSLRAIMGNKKDSYCDDFGGDLVYIENY